MDKRVVKFLEWAEKSAKWWQFWDPRSGVCGGLIGGAIIVFIIYVLWG